MLDRVSDVSPLDTLPEGSELYTLTNGQSVEVSFEHPTAPQDVIPTTDIILFAGFERIDSFAITGSATSKVAFSDDGGSTWKKFSNDEWLEISSISDGNSVSEIPNIPTDSLFEFASKNNKLRISYHIEPNEKNTQATLLATIKGPIQFAPKTSFDVSYDEMSRKIRYNILTAGDYYVNYADAE